MARQLVGKQWRHGISDLIVLAKVKFAGSFFPCKQLGAYNGWFPAKAIPVGEGLKSSPFPGRKVAMIVWMNEVGVEARRNGVAGLVRVHSPIVLRIPFS